MQRIVDAEAASAMKIRPDRRRRSRVTSAAAGADEWMRRRIRAPETATNARASRGDVAADGGTMDRCRMYIRARILDAVIVSVLVAELMSAAVRLAGG